MQTVIHDCCMSQLEAVQAPTVSATVSAKINLMLVILIHAVISEVCVIILVHAEGLDCVAGVAPCALHNNG